MVNTKVTLSGWELDNPVIPASGTFGYGREFASLYPLDMLGTFSFKGTTVSPRFGNPTPRIAEWDAGIINSIGLQNPGVDHVLSCELPEMKKYFNKKVIANVSGFEIPEYVSVVEKFRGKEQIGIFEINISCPNVKNGLSFGTDPESAFEVTKAVKAVADKPVFMKLSPNVTDIVSVAKACEEGGADGLSMINALVGMRIDLKRKKPIIANRLAGYAGKALFPMALGMVYRVYEAVKIPIIGIGGVSTAYDVIEMMLAGATAVGVGSANLIDPYVSEKIIEDLPCAMEKLGIDDLSEIIGKAHGDFVKK